MQDRRPLLPLIGVAAVVVAADHLTKWLALRHLQTRDIDLVWTLRLHLTENSGAAFSLGSRFAPLIALVAVVVVIGLFGLGRKLRGRVPLVAAGAIAGGAIGNLLDRLLRHGHGFLGGHVVDFIDLRWWPVFNVADMAITLGAVALALTLGRE